MSMILFGLSPESDSVRLALDFARQKYINRKVMLSSSQSIAKKPLRNFALNFAKLCGKIYQTREMIWVV